MSMITTGIDDRTASSTSTMSSPVLPLPVMPSTTAWVTKSSGGR
jgi:hypothetical protein